MFFVLLFFLESHDELHRGIGSVCMLVSGSVHRLLVGRGVKLAGGASEDKYSCRGCQPVLISRCCYVGEGAVLSSFFYGRGAEEE